jgi:hypothetical protein
MIADTLQVVGMTMGERDHVDIASRLPAWSAWAREGTAGASAAAPAAAH